MTPSPHRVLLVEDNFDNQYLVTELLRHEGYEVVLAGDGAAALATAARGGFALVLLDLQLPDIDGFEVARRLRQLDAVKTLPIIAVSAFAMSSDRRKAFAAGCTGYLEKPIDPDHFVHQVRCQAGLVSAE